MSKILFVELFDDIYLARRVAIVHRCLIQSIREPLSKAFYVKSCIAGVYPCNIQNGGVKVLPIITK